MRLAEKKERAVALSFFLPAFCCFRSHAYFVSDLHVLSVSTDEPLCFSCSLTRCQVHPTAAL